MLSSLCLALLINLPAPTQSPTLAPPQPNYAIYGSLSRQRTVYNNLLQQNEAQKLREYRKFREEARRQAQLNVVTYVYRERPIVVRSIR